MKCAKCGSENIQFATRTSGSPFSASDSCCGFLLLGPLGILCGLCGSDVSTEEFWVCRDCGKKFTEADVKAKDKEEREAAKNYQKQKEILSSKLKEENGAIVLHAASPGIFLGRNSEGNPVRAEIRSLPGIRDLSGEWTVKFPENSGIAGIRTIPRLHSLSESPETEIRYFSGTAEYKKSFPLSAEELKFRSEGRWILDLGEVCDGASVRLNGRDLGILWKPPFRCDVTDFLVAGENQLTVDVTNRWINRLIGDERLPPDAEYRTRVEFMLLKFPDWFLSGKQSPTGRRAFATYRHWKKNDPLQKSGLPGPVRLIPVRKQELR